MKIPALTEEDDDNDDGGNGDDEMDTSQEVSAFRAYFGVGMKSTQSWQQIGVQAEDDKCIRTVLMASHHDTNLKLAGNTSDTGVSRKVLAEGFRTGRTMASPSG